MNKRSEDSYKNHLTQMARLKPSVYHDCKTLSQGLEKAALAAAAGFVLSIP